jgi:hypothetical protein
VVVEIVRLGEAMAAGATASSASVRVLSFILFQVLASFPSLPIPDSTKRDTMPVVGILLELFTLHITPCGVRIHPS